MNDKTPKILLCNCAKTMTVDGAAIGAALGGNALAVHTQLCRTDIAAYEAALGGDQRLLVACTQEAPLFSEVAAEAQAGSDVAFGPVENGGIGRHVPRLWRRTDGAGRG